MFIEKIFKTLSTTEKKEFLLFLDRKKRKANRKDIQICKSLMSNIKPSIENANNYHAIRNRIKKELIIFIHFKQVEKDTTKESELENEINLCRFLFKHHLENEAWNHLLKLEKRATEINNYRSIYRINLLMLEFSHTNESIDIYALINKKNELKILIDKEESLLDTLAIARNKLKLFKTNAKTQSLITLIDKIKNEIDINHPSFYNNPKQVLYYLELIRGSLLYNRDIRELEPIAIELYNKTSFTSYTVEYELRILYIIAHALYRNQKLQLCLKYTAKIEALLKICNTSRFNFYYSKTIALKTSVQFLTNEINTAIHTTEKFLNSKITITKEDELNLKLNLLTFLAYNKDYKTANRFFIQMHHSDNWYKKLMGKEWVFKKNSIEMLLQFEMGKDDIALNRLNNILKTTKELTILPQYKDVIYFLNLFKQYIENPTTVSESDLLAIFKKENVISEDNEIKKSAFYNWFLAKLRQKDPYEFLLSSIKELAV